MKKIKNALVILAGGTGKRFGKNLPKQFNEINGENLIHFFLKRVDTRNFDIILIVLKHSHYKYIKNLKFDFPSVDFLFPAIKSRSVDLPTPLGPIIPTLSSGLKL